MLLALGLAANAFLATFAGSWACSLHAPGMRGAAISHWSIAPAPASSWAVVHWSGGRESGTAYVGYLAPEKLWTYEDFHDDGSFGTNTSPGPQNGSWTWSGSFTSRERVLHGSIVWSRPSADRLRMGFGRLIGTSFRESAYSTCRPAT